MKNYSLYVNYNGRLILGCEGETSADAECFKDALLTMHQNMMKYAYEEDFDAGAKSDFLMCADLLIAIYLDLIPYDHETDEDRAEEALFVIDATEYIEKHFSAK